MLREVQAFVKALSGHRISSLSSFRVTLVDEEASKGERAVRINALLGGEVVRVDEGWGT